MKPKFKAIIFDFDGVLVDTETLWVKAYAIWLKNHNLKNDPKIYKLMIGRGLKENMELAKKHLGVRGDIGDLLKEIREIMYHLILQKKDLIMPGVIKLLPILERYKLAIATGGHTKKGLEKILTDLQIRDYFDEVISSDNVKLGKPAPDVYLETAKLLGIRPLECAVAEDSVNGVESGKAAGMYVVGVNINIQDRNALKEAGADEVIESLKELKI